MANSLTMQHFQHLFVAAHHIGGSSSKVSIEPQGKIHVFDSRTKTAKQAGEALETNLTTVTNQFSQAVEKTVNQTAKK